MDLDERVTGWNPAATTLFGYLPEEANADAFVDGWYRTGDVGTIDGSTTMILADAAPMTTGSPTASVNGASTTSSPTVPPTTVSTPPTVIPPTTTTCRSRSPGAAAGAGLTALTIGLKQGLTTAIETEHQMARLSGVLQTTGNTAGFTAEGLDRFSRELARATLTSTQEVRQAAAALATFGTIGGEAFTTTLSLAQDMAEVMGGDLRSNTVQLAKTGKCHDRVWGR